jgi:hypothetical protein
MVRSLGVRSTEIADLAGEESLGRDVFLFGQSSNCDQSAPIPHEIDVGADEMIGADVIVDSSENKTVGGHYDFGDRWPSDLLIDHEGNNSGHSSGHFGESFWMEFLCDRSE